MQELSDAAASDPASRGPALARGWWTPALIVVFAIAISIDAIVTAIPANEEGVPWVIGVIFTWALSMIGMVMRNPQRQLRISEPGVLVLLWAAYYFIAPAMSWLHGSAFSLEPPAVSLTTDLVVQVQQLHILFLVVLVGVYMRVLPRFGFQPLENEQLNKLPRARWWILIGLLPSGIETITRLIETGTIRPETSYIDAVSDVQRSVDNARAAGGSDYLLTQVFTKLRFYGEMVLGTGLALYLVRCWRTKRRWGIIAFHAGCPILLYLSAGSRSAAVFPFIIALIVTDYLAGPISWKYILTMIVTGFFFFYAYGFFRVHQDEDLPTALASAMDDLGESRELDVAEAENSLMLLKETYAIARVEQMGSIGLAEDLKNALLLPVPQQLTGEKSPTITDVLGRDLLGDKMYDEGFALAGSLIAEGYMAAGVLGVIVLALLLGLLIAGSVRLLVGLDWAQGTPLWRVMLLGVLTSQSVLFIRSEMGILVSFYLYYVLLPWGVVQTINRGIGKWAFSAHPQSTEIACGRPDTDGELAGSRTADGHS